MLGVLLVILKIIAIIIVSTIGILLTVIFLILFVPVKYSIEGLKNQEKVILKAKFTYLNPILRADVLIGEENNIDIRMLGCKISQIKTDHQNFSDINEAPDKELPKKKTKKGWKTKDTLSKINEYIKIVSNDKEQLVVVLKIIFKAILSILPKEGNAEIKFGTGNADTTGYVLAFYCAIEELLPKQCCIFFEPVWIEKYLEGKFRLSGRIRIIFIVTAIIKIVCNKEVRRFYKLIRSV